MQNPLVAQDIIALNTLAGFPNRQGAAKKPSIFVCPHDCGRKKTTFTTAYRLKTHINRYHTLPTLQKRYECGFGTCKYSTTYSTDLPRHRKSCKQSNAGTPST
ncbi:hypothetical protein HYPSUDRAFT_69074 [Hypholoma sublateritium FD-334 SS-4]|uniref:Uncharacterized protein n=1 Tax=Hypholoma sublateritium (strain FD-334 SS-4) TaxID=945553 RepID=A0A0D2KZ71_HYPSF|nr:hypothetical protein HYPSUDRAFT_69074 [Hypholoma sublateritium FD-334 SS-4]